MTRFAATCRRAWTRLTQALTPWRAEADLARELAAHVSLLEDDFRRRGLSPDEARAAARRAMGGIERAKELHREARSFAWIDDARRDAWQTFRTLRRHRGFTAVAILTLAIGIGANTALFSAFNAVVLRPLPYRDPDRLAVLSPSPFGLTSGPVLAAWREQARHVEAFAGFNGPAAATLVERGAPTSVDYADITWNFMSFLGTPPALGRDFTEGDTRAGAPRVTLLSHDFWKRRFGSDPAIVGRTISIDGTPLVVIGIAAPAFRFPVTGMRPATGTAEDTQPGVLRLATATQPVNALARLAAGATAQLVSAELLPIYKGVALRDYRRSLVDRATVAVTPLHEQLASQLRRWLLLVMGTVAIVLAVASANVANLLLAHASSRRREFALRSAIGARTGRLVRLVMTESLVLALLASGVALAMAWWATSALHPLLADRMPHVAGIQIDWRVFAFNVAVAAGTGLLCGLASVATITRLDLAATFNDGGTPAMSRKTGLRRGLLLAEVGFSFVLVVGAVLLAQTVRNLETKERGFDAHDVLTMRVSPHLDFGSSRNLAAAAASLNQYSDAVANAVGAVPGIRSVSFSTIPPLTGTGPGFGGLAVEGLTPPEDRNASVVFVSPDYFPTLKTPIVAGRNILDTDSATATTVVVVNEAFQRRFAHGLPIVGRRITVDKLALTIVGVARDVVPRTLRDPAEPLMFVPLAQSARTPIFWAQLTLVARTTGVRPADVAADVRRAVWSIEPTAVIADVTTLDDRVADSLRTERQSAVIFTGLAAIALLIAAIGVYGVATYAVVQRTKELGIRLALGADQRDLIRLIGHHAVVPVLGGIGLGIVVAFGSTRLLGSMLYGVTALDAGSFAAAAAVLTIAALAATIAPTRRVLRLDPLEALRTE